MHTYIPGSINPKFIQSTMCAISYTNIKSTELVQCKDMSIKMLHQIHCIQLLITLLVFKHKNIHPLAKKNTDLL